MRSDVLQDLFQREEMNAVFVIYTELKSKNSMLAV